MANTLCVIHLGSKRRSGRLGTAPAWTAAGLRGGAGWTPVWSCGGGGAVLAVRAVLGSSGLLGRTDRRVVALRSELGGQDGRSWAGGEEIR